MDYLIPTAVAMEDFGHHLAHACQGRCIIYLCGELGTGKTTLVRGFLRALGYQGAVKSPTYTLVEPYYLNQHTIYHFDLYRLNDPEELEYLGIRDYVDNKVICLIEWAERGRYYIPTADVTIQLFHQGEARLLRLQATDDVQQLVSATRPQSK